MTFPGHQLETRRAVHHRPVYLPPVSTLEMEDLNSSSSNYGKGVLNSNNDQMNMMSQAFALWHFIHIQ